MGKYISINGFMGCGKSSVGERLAGRLSCGLTDLDRYIEEKSGRQIKEIFASEGEAAFRRMEKEALKEILGKEERKGAMPSGVVSLGGGTVTTPECAGMVKDLTVCIYLRAGTDTLVENLRNDFSSRPMLENPDGEQALRARIKELMSIRSRIYEDTASITIDIDGKSFDEVTSEILSCLGLPTDRT